MPESYFLRGVAFGFYIGLDGCLNAFAGFKMQPLLYGIFFLAGMAFGLFIAVLFFRKRIEQYQDALIRSEIQNEQARMITTIWNKVMGGNYDI